MKYIHTSILFLFFASSIKSQNINFKSTITKLEDNIEETMQKGVEDGWYGVMTIPDFLFMMITQDKDVYYIFCHPSKYKKEILMYINNDSVKWEYKYLALGLPLLAQVW